MSASSLPRCSGCGNERGPWRPSGAVLPSGEQVLVCTTGCPGAELADAVAEHGPFPMPVGAPDSLTEILARADAATPGPWCTDAWEIYQGTEYLPGLSWWIGETCRGTSTPEQDRADATFVAAARTDVPKLVAEVDRLRTRVAELEAARTTAAADRDKQIITWLAKKAGEYGTSNRENRAKAEAVGRMADKLSRGAVRPACPPVTAESPWERAVAGLNALADADIAFWIEPDGHISGPFGDEHIEWNHDAARWRLVHDDENEDPLRVTPEQAHRIERDRPETNTAHDCNLPLNRRLDCGHCPHEVCQDCQRCPHTCRCASPEDPHDSPLHHRYDTPRDLPEVPW